MMARTPKWSGHNAQWLWLSLAIIALDQATKQLVATHFYLFQSVRLTGFLNLTYVRNTGVAFSMFNQGPRLVFIAVGVFISLAILVWLYRHPRDSRVTAVALSLILAGALGNVIDRALWGYVIDFIDFHVEQWHWPAFNVADSAVTIGAVLLVIDAVWPRRESYSGRDTE